VQRELTVNIANHFAVIVAGGRGTRMGTDVPKQFLLLGGKPVLMHSIRAFHTAIPGINIVLVLPKDQQEVWAQLCLTHQFTVPHRVVDGGIHRFHSVKNGLNALEGSGWVAVHDGVRPLIRPETILRLFGDAANHSNAIPAITPKDSVRWQENHQNRVISRDLVKLIQTPQVFELNKLKAAYVQEYEDSFTDDATVWEKAGNPVYLAVGQEDNIKITTADDLIIAGALLINRH
jgi:2-C-methyl-D-erythritol 4-phosphate cytidylyltransferase